MDDNGSSRLDRLEKVVELLGDAVKGLVDHAEATDNRINRLTDRVETLTAILTENNERIGNLVSAIGA